MQTSHYALAEISNRIQEGLNSEALKGQGTLFTDALAAYLKRHYVRFANELNEEAKRLNAEMRQELEDSGFDPDTDPKVKAAYDKWQDLKDQWFDTPADSVEANQLYKDALAASDDYWDARDQVFRKELRKRGFTEVFNEREDSQKLTLSTQVEVHKRAVNAVNKFRVNSAEDINAANELLYFSSDFSTAPKNSREMLKALRQIPSQPLLGAMGDVRVHGRNRLVLRTLKNDLRLAIGEHRSIKLLGKLNVAFFTPQFYVEGGYAEVNGQPTIWLEDLSNKFNSTRFSAMHEVVHYLFGGWRSMGLYKDSGFAFENRNGRYEPIGELAKEVDRLMKSEEDIRDTLDYPMTYLDDLAPEEVNAEILAQIGVLWLVSKNNRRYIANRAPKLNKIFTDYLLGGKDNGGPSKQTGRSLGRMGRSDLGREIQAVKGIRSQGRESDILASRLPRTGQKSTGSVESNKAGPESRRGVYDSSEEMDSSARSQNPTSTRAGQGTGSESGHNVGNPEAKNVGRASGENLQQRRADQEIRKSAEIANPEPSFIQRVINRLPAERRPLAQAVADTAAGWFGDYGVSKFLCALFTTDLARMVKKVMPSIQKWIDKKKERDAWINTRQQELGHYRQRFNELPKDVQDKLNTLWADTTLSGIWIAKPAWANATQWAYMQDEGDKATRISLTADYNKLPPEAQRLYNDVLQYGHDSMVLKNTLLAEKANEYLRTLEESSKDAEELQDLKDSLKATLQLAQDRIKVFNKPYVPLLRRGSHVVVARSQELINLQNEREELRKQRREDREWTDDAKERLKEVNKQILKLEQSQSDYVVSFVDSQAQANRLATELRKDFNGHVEAFPLEEIGR